MKLTDAFWEKRNLGVSTEELSVAADDTKEDVRDCVRNMNSEYQVVKVPAGMVDVMWMLEEEGFRYMETAINVTHNLKNLELSGILERIDKGITYEPMTEEDKQRMFMEIEQGMFDTDRISLDPYFSKELANRRYVGWISDEIEKGSELFKYMFKGQPVGFFIFKKISDEVYYPFLAGIYKEYQSSPVGMVYLYKPLLEAKKRGAKLISTYISTNNANAVRLHVRFGFEFKDTTYVYVKHVKE